MKKIVLTILKILGVLLLLILIVGGVLLYKGTNYEMYPLSAENLTIPDNPTQADFQTLAEQLVAEMTLEEKIDQMYGEKYGGGMLKFIANFITKQRFAHIYVGRNERLGIPPWVLSDGPRGARVLDNGVEAVTTFPVAMSRGASWNTDLEYRINQVISTEMRANKTNYGATPCINLLRHPGWGRAQETYGEDPWHLGEFGVAAVKGLEDNDVMACPKHFALNSIDNSRWVLDVEVDERTLREVYLPHFKKTVQEGKPASIMSAYNAVNGDFCGSNKMLLTDILREDWEFEGFVSTDWIYGVYDGVGGVKAGLNVEMPFQKSYSYEALQEGIDTGEISEADIDKLVVNTLATRLRYAYNNHPEDYPASRILEQSSIDLSREAAEEGIVLLKNENVLPFQQKQGKKVAVIGRLADVENTGDQGSSNSTPPYVITPYQGIKDYQTALGNEVVLNDGSDLDAAKQLAEEADEVIVIVGFTHEDEGEYIILNREDMLANAKAGQSLKEGGTGGDRADLSLSESDEALIQKLAGRNLNLAVVYVGGSAIDLSTWEDKVPAILFAWYAGMEGGNALANVLYGEVSPSGKLPFSIAKSQEDYPKFTPFATQIKYDYYHGYTLFDKQEKAVAYPFGFGLSYANFSYDSLSIQQAEIASSGSLEVQVKVTNNSAISAKEIVQLYIGFPNSPVDRPVKLLRDFNKIALAPQESKWVNLSVAAEDLAWYNPEKESWVIDAVEYEVYVGGSSEEGDLLKGRFKVMENRER